MKQDNPSEAKSIGAILGGDRSRVRTLLDEAQRLETLQSGLNDWTARHARMPAGCAEVPTGISLRVVAERDATLVIYGNSAAALTAIRYRQDELLSYLRERFSITASKIVTKIVPSP